MSTFGVNIGVKQLITLKEKNSLGRCEKLLVGLGVSSDGHLDDFEVIDLSNPEKVCKRFPELPRPDRKWTKLPPDVQMKLKIFSATTDRDDDIPNPVDPDDPALAFRQSNGMPVLCKSDCFRFEVDAWKKISGPNRKRCP